MRILITGASGFVGRNVKEYLENKLDLDIYAPSSKELDCIDEIAVRKYLTQYKFDVVLHFAVYGDGIDRAKDGSKVLEYNLRMFLNFANYSTLFGKMIYTGSGAEYDKRYDISMAVEDEIGKTIPIDQYGLMKYTIGKIIDESNNIYNLRLFGIFGKYEYWQTKFISNLCCKAIKGLPLSIRQNCKFDYLWIDDFCRMLERFIYIKEPIYHTYNAVRGKPIELVALANMIQNISDNKIFICRKGYANEYTASNKRIISEIPDFEYTDMRESIKALFDYYLEHNNDIDILSLIYG